MTETPLESTSTPRRATLDEREKQLLEVQHQLITRNAELATALSKLEESELLRVSAENRWQNAMRRLHERFGDCLAVHKADIEALLGRLQGEAAALHTAASVGPAGTKEDANAGSARDSNTEDDWHNPGDLLEINQLQSRLDSARKAFCAAVSGVDLCDGTKETQPIKSAAMLDLEESLWPGPGGGKR